MADRQFLSATKLANVVHLAFALPSNQIPHFTVTIPEENANRLITETVRALAQGAHAPFIRSVLGIRQVPPADATQPMTLRIVCETTVGRLELPISHTGAVELEEALRNMPLARGSRSTEAPV